MKRGKFIVFDGMDGIGKGANAKRLVRALYERDKTINLFLTREPFASESYTEIRSILATNKDPYQHAQELAQLFVKDRRTHADVIEYLLSRGIYVVCDRYKYSTLVYQSQQGIPFNELVEMHKGLPVPDLTFILDAPVDVALARMNIDTTRGHFEVFEQKAFLEKIRVGFRSLPQQLADERIIIIDANHPIEEVFANVYAEVEKIL